MSNATTDETDEPPLTANWGYREYDDGGKSLYGRFENGWRFEIKPIDGQTYYNLGRPLDDRKDEWAEACPIEDWSFIPFERVMEDLRNALESADSMADLADADTDVVMEYGRFFEMIEREGLDENTEK